MDPFLKGRRVPWANQIPAFEILLFQQVTTKLGAGLRGADNSNACRELAERLTYDQHGRGVGVVKAKGHDRFTGDESIGSGARLRDRVSVFIKCSGPHLVRGLVGIIRLARNYSSSSLVPLYILILIT